MSFLNADSFNSGHKKKFHAARQAESRVADQDDFLIGKHCLVLDDEFIIALDIQQILEAAGAAGVVSVSTVAEAMAALGERQFDLAVLDVKMSDDAAGNSMALAALLSEQRIAFVFLTGMRSDDVHARAFPGAPVVEKPYLAPVLLQALRRALAGAQKPPRR
jgi:CheY-like chemotaxis protein